MYLTLRLHHKIGIHGAIKGAGMNEYDKVCNIYDLEGNVREISAEKLQRSQDTYECSVISRGGFYSLNNYPGWASGRPYDNDYASWAEGYRMALYVMK